MNYFRRGITWYAEKFIVVQCVEGLLHCKCLVQREQKEGKASEKLKRFLNTQTNVSEKLYEIKSRMKYFIREVGEQRKRKNSKVERVSKLVH